MISPLKTWHHQEPKGLWPALGGLALLTHIGVLGLSLPYVLNMMQSAGRGTAAAIPIELIEVDSTMGFAEPEAQSPEPAAASSEAAPQAETGPASEPPSVQTFKPTVPSSSNSVRTSPSSLSPIAQTLPPQAEDTPQNNETPAERNEDQSETPNADSLGSETSSDGGSDADAGEADETGPSTLPMGGPTLPSPDEASEESDHNQVAYLKLDKYSYVPENLRTIDLADTPATPIEAVSAIVLDAKSTSCDRVEFPQPSKVTYRVEVSPGGTLRSALPWTGSIEPYDMSEQEKAISCLIVSAGFQFAPATQEGSPVANSDLLLTIDIVESGVN